MTLSSNARRYHRGVERNVPGAALQRLPMTGPLHGDVGDDGERPRVEPLHAPLDSYRVVVVLDAGEQLTNEHVTRLYCALASLGAEADWRDGRLLACFQQPARSAEVAAWSVIDEVAALPDAVIERVETGLEAARLPELLLVRRTAADSARAA